MKLKLSLFILLCFTFLNADNSTQSSNQPPPIVSFQKEMSRKEMQNLGLNKLNAAQLTALEDWVTNWAQKNVSPESKLPGDALVAIVGEGQFVKLANGQVWNLSPNAWLYAYYWEKGDIITSQKGLDMLFPYSITNQRTGQQVNAKKGSKQITENLSSEFTISQIINNGEFVKLSNNSTWQVEPSARYMVEGWSLGQPIFVMQRFDAVGYELYNGATARTVLAVPFNSSKVKMYDEKRTQSTKQVTSSNFNQISPPTSSYGKKMSSGGTPGSNSSTSASQSEPIKAKVTAANYTEVIPQKVVPQSVTSPSATNQSSNKDSSNASTNTSTTNKS